MRWIVIALLSATLLGGCIRIDFDLCEEASPPPDCALDAGVDAGDVDATADSG